jgi:hypothetical protein
MSLTCGAQNFHSVTITTLQFRRGWHCYMRNGSMEIDGKATKAVHRPLQQNSRYAIPVM